MHPPPIPYSNGTPKVYEYFAAKVGPRIEPTLEEEGEEP